MFINNNGHDPHHGTASLVMLDHGEIIAAYSSWEYAYMDMAKLEKYQPSGRYQIKRASILYK